MTSGPVAQWSEQGTHNPLVVGSIPTWPTKKLAILMAILLVALTTTFVISEVIISKPTNKVCVRGDNFECR